MERRALPQWLRLRRPQEVSLQVSQADVRLRPLEEATRWDASAVWGLLGSWHQAVRPRARA